MEGKKSFLLYCDMIHSFEALTDEQAGKLIKIIFEYVNDKNPHVDDPLLNYAFISIKISLKRDLDEWKKICERNSNNGSKGGRPKTEGIEIKPKEPTGFSGNPKNPVKPDSDSDSDKDILNENSHNEIFMILLNSQAWIEARAMENKVEIQEVQNHLNRFRIECIGKDEFKVSEKDAKNHFMNWIKRGNPFPEKKSRPNILDTLSSFQNNDF